MIQKVYFRSKHIFSNILIHSKLYISRLKYILKYILMKGKIHLYKGGTKCSLKWAYPCRTYVSVSTFVGHLSVECPIQKIFVGFLKILTPFYNNFKRYKYNNFLKTQIYYINFYYDYKNKEQNLLIQSWNISSCFQKNLKHTFAHKYLFSIQNYIINKSVSRVLHFRDYIYLRVHIRTT